jgi:hypothetical protein
MHSGERHRKDLKARERRRSTGAKYTVTDNIVGVMTEFLGVLVLKISSRKALLEDTATSSAD